MIPIALAGFLVSSPPETPTAVSAACRHPFFPAEAGAVWTYRSTATSRQMGGVGPVPPPFEYQAGILAVSSNEFVVIEAWPLAGRQETPGMVRRWPWRCRPDGLVELAKEGDDGARTTGVTLPRDLAPGRAWTVRTMPASPPAGGAMAWECRFRVAERASVRAPKGEVMATVVDGDCAGGPRFRRQTRDFWVEGIGLVKREVTSTSTIGVASDRIELIAFQVLPVAEAAARLDVDSAAARRRHLSSSTRDADPGVRRWAVEALGKPWDREALEVLMKALEDSDQDVRIAASNAIGDSKDRQLVPVLIAALEDPRPATRWGAAHALGSLAAEARPDANAIAALAALLGDRDAQVRLAGAQALGRIASPATRDALSPLLRDKDPSMRSVAALNIGLLAARGVDTAHLKEALRALATGDPDAQVREFARGALDLMERRTRP